MKNSKYHVDLGSIVACKKRKMESTKELCQSNSKGATKYFFLFGRFFPQRCHMKLQCILLLTLLVWLKPIQKCSVRMPSKIWQIIGKEVLTSCWIEILGSPYTGRQLLLAEIVTIRRISLLSLQCTHVSQRLVFRVYLIALNSFLIFIFPCCFSPFCV